MLVVPAVIINNEPFARVKCFPLARYKQDSQRTSSQQECKSDAFQGIQRYDATQVNVCSQFAYARTYHTRLHINANNIPHIEHTLSALSTDTRVRSQINTTSSQRRAVI